MTASLPGRRFPGVTERLLEDGRTIDEPDELERTELERLESMGLVSVRWSQTFLCVDHGDDHDLRYAHDRACNQRISLTTGHRDDPCREEDDREYICPACGRAHWPLRRRRTLYPQARIGLAQEDVATWLEAQLGKIVDSPGRIGTAAVWRFPQDDDELYVVLLDACLDTRYATRGFARSQRVLYVVIDHRAFSARFIDADWLRFVFLHEVVAGGLAGLRERLTERGPGPLLCQEPATPVWLPMRSPQPRAASRVLGMHRLELAEGVAKLDDVVVVPSGAEALLEVLGFFAARWREDMLDGKGAADHCAYSPDEVLEDQEERGVAKTQAAGTIRRHINRLRNTIQRRYMDATGLGIGKDAVVERVEGGGFRLNASTAVVMG